MQPVRPQPQHARIVSDHRKPKPTKPSIFHINNARVRTQTEHYAVCVLAFSPRNVKAHHRLPSLDVFFTCSSNLLMMAWTHSTGLCAAMLRRMREPQPLLSITFAILISVPGSPPMHLIPPKALQKIIQVEKCGGGGGGSGLVLHF